MASNVSVGKTAPVPLGQQPASNSLPVVFAEDQKPIPVEEQNKVQSEVALSLLGIPRSEVALGIFADVNTYDVNPIEWAQFPIENIAEQSSDPNEEGTVLDGVVHVPKEAGAQLLASDGNTTILTSKRFFRYQPGRVSASTMGVKMNITSETETDTQKGAPSIKKWGIFDKFDGYYFEIVNNGAKNNFRCVRRTQAIIPGEPNGYNGELKWFKNGGAVTAANAKFNGSTNLGLAGVDPVIVRDGLVYVAAAIYDPSLVYHPDSVKAIDSDSSPENRLKDFQSNSEFGLRLAQYNGTTYTEILKDRKFQFPFDQSTTYPLNDAFGDDKMQDSFLNYIRADAHCNFYGLISNLARKGSVNHVLSSFSELIDQSTDWQEVFFGAGTNVESETHDLILGRSGAWDAAPSTTNSQAKVWHLLVNTLGGNNITQTHYNDAPGVPINRTITNGNVTLKEWFNICVPKPFRFVYEWRPVRAMFSGDKLDGDLTSVRWSDINTSAEFSLGGTGDGLVNRPGEVITTPEGVVESQSAYNIDFTKVTMWKTEFSWYGAVGATFLCYVPVGNNEARWVRVHHIRASNQHSVASLGNAFLPITYLCHGGLNSGLDPKNNGVDVGNTLVKYGASYYIDGGDKGTVKLLSKSSDYSRTVPSGTVKFTPVSRDTTNNSIVVTRTALGTSTDTTLVGVMGAYIEGDVTTKVKWMEKSSTTEVRLYFTGDIPASGDITLIVPRSQQSLLTLRAKDFISNREGDKVRNRLQIYPLKLGAGVSQGETSDLITIRGYKNPLLIATNSGSPSASLLSGSISDTINTKRSVLPIEFTTAQVTALGLSTVLDATGEYVFGYFIGSENSNNAGNIISGKPILGRIFREGTKYYFAKFFSYPDPIYIKGSFLFERNLSVGTAATGLSFAQRSITSTTSGYADQTKWTKLASDDLATFEEITRLSGTQVAQDFALTPVPETGNEIFSYYVTRGGYQFDLQDYFAYNKEYLSFPLTDEVDVISIFGHFDIQQSDSPKAFKVNTSLTWEEQ